MNKQSSGIWYSCFQENAKNVLTSHYHLLIWLALLFANNAFSQITISFPEVNEPSCNGFTNGSVLAQIEGGMQPYVLEWNTGDTGLGIFGVGAGEYTLTVTDANSQTASASYLLGQPDPVVPNLTFLNSPCTGSPVDIQAVPTGGTPPYSFEWGDGTTADTRTDLTLGTYFITVTDANGCAGIESISINEAMQIFLTSVPPACPGGCDASASVAVLGGQMPYSYLWSNGATGSVNPNLLPGIQSVTVTDANGCMVSSTIIIEDGESDLALSVEGENAVCNGTGSAEAIPAGGIPPYQYEWNTGAQTATIENLFAGTYTVTLTDAAGCEQIASVVILTENDLSVLVEVDYICGDPFGSATATATGGVPPYSFEWNDGQTGPMAINLTPGETYKVTVTDQEECTIAKTILVADIDELDIAINASLPSCDGFFDGTATAFVLGGSGDYTFLWEGGQQNPTIEFLGPGTYTVTVSDENGCGGTATTTIVQPNPIEITTTTTNAICGVPNSGTVEATVTGGTPPYTYMWNTYATGSDHESPILTDLPPGPYTVLVKDVNGCEAMAAFTIEEEEDLALSISSQAALCGQNNGSATVTASAGTAPYTYQWDDASAQTTATASDLGAGTYSVTVTDANGCQDIAQVTIADSPAVSCIVNIDNPVTTPGGSDGQLSVMVQGGTPPFDFLWNNGMMAQTITDLPTGSYSVTVTDANGCETTCEATLVQPARLGDYVWIDSNENGIQDPAESGFAGVEVILTGTTQNGESITKSTSTNNDGFYFFDVQPGTYKVTFTAPNNYKFTNSNIGSDDSIDSDADADTGMTDFVDIAAGEENLTIDAGLTLICININDPGEICCDQVLCGPGQDPDPILSVTLPSGGSGPIEYLWMKTVTEGPFNPAYWEPIPDSNTPSYDPGPLSETTYFARCARRENCGSFLETSIIEIAVSDEAVASILTPQLPVCIGEEVVFMAESNGPGATYSWNFGGGATPLTSNEQNPSVSWSSAGPREITLTVTANGCTSVSDMRITVTMGPVFCGNGLVIDADNFQGGSAQVNWEMHAPNGNYEYEVESSPDGSDFEWIGTVSEPLEYDPVLDMNKMQFIDHAPHPNISYYRVRFTDEYGNEYISNIDEVRFDNPEDDAIRLYPTPFEDNIYIELVNYTDTKDMFAEIRGSNGYYLRQEVFENDQFSKRIEMTNYPAGIYFIRIWKEGEAVETFKIIKIRR
ncbi:MAG: carboxypeptidase regulatory-like domain-containing protein [Saprospiraceae bacterium]|nr:carboxypeptidase regulatory-like domain-containing protein [Saprospiraceae bacterium]